jgi:CBS domain-containing protein
MYALFLPAPPSPKELRFGKTAKTASLARRWYRRQAHGTAFAHAPFSSSQEIPMKAGDVMTTGAATVRPDASLADAARILTEHRISGLPVVAADGTLVGIVTEQDFLRQDDGKRPRWFNVLTETGGQAAARALQEKRVQDVMTRSPVSAGVETPVGELVALMERHGVKRLPVVENGKVIGIVSRANLVQALLRKADSAGPTSR